MIKDFIFKLRKKENLSQEELAKKIGISRPTLISIEKGKRDITLTELKKLSKIFGISVNTMLDEELKIDEKLKDTRQKSFRKFNDLVFKCIKYGSDDDGRITKTKLAKLVYLCDFKNYYETLNPISGFEYRRLAQGPVAIEFFDLIDSDESIYVESKGKSMLVSLIEDPNSSSLSKEEEGIVKDVCSKWKNHRTQEIVEFTHNQLPWATSKEGEAIPYELINMEDPENVY